MTKRDRFSINIDEDYELYGIDPDINLDDWSFLDQKPEPIPEKTEEEKRLFEQLLAPSIPEEEIQAEIHDRLKSLIAETTEFIKNDVKVELSAPIEIPDEQIKPMIDTNSFEHKQAVRMSTMMKDMIRSTQKAEDITDFIKNITKSDELEKQILAQEEELEPVPLAEDAPTPSQEPAPTPTPAVPAPVPIPEPPKPESKKEQTSFLGRYKRKVGAVNTIIRDLDETERLSSKFLMERKKREEEAEKEAARIQKEIEERQNKFFASLELEAEKHRREVQMEQEIKASKAPTMSDMLKQIGRDKAKPEPAQPKPKPKPKEEKPARASSQQIAEFMAEREKIVSKTKEKPMLLVDLDTNKIQEPKVSSHYSKTFKKNVETALKAKLIPLLKRRKQLKIKKAWKVLIFMRFARQLAAAKARKELLLRKRQQEQTKLDNAKQLFSAIMIQCAWRKFRIAQKAKRAEEKAKQQKEKEEMSALDKARKVLAEHMAPTPPPPKQTRTFHFPQIQDPDTAWLHQRRNPLDLLDDDDFLDDLPDRPVSSSKKLTGINGEEITGPFQAESQSIPIQDDIDDYLAKFNQKLPVQDPPPVFTRIDPGQRKPDATTTQEVRVPEKEEDDLIRRAKAEGYDFKDPKTAQRMQKMMQRRFNGSGSLKDETGMERFNRLYGNNRGGPAALVGSNEPPRHVYNPHVHRSSFKKNDQRAKRLQKLKKVWLSGPPDESQHTPE